MAQGTWIKMMVDMFEGMSFKRIRRARIGGEKFRDKLTAVWFEIMALAGRCNNDGALVDQSGIVLSTLDDIATQIDREEEEVELCMTFYLNEGMITHTEGVYSITNWAEYQNVDGLAKIREQTRQRVAKCREKKKLLEGNGQCNATVTLGNALEEEGEEDKEKDKENSFYHSGENEFLKNDFSTGFSTNFSTGEDKMRKKLGGELGKGVVMLSDEQMADLLDKLSIEEFDHYVSVVADCILKGKPFRKKTHYQAILDMALADRKIK